MTKVTEQDVVHFLREKVAKITNELAIAQSALDALEEMVLHESPGAKEKKSGTLRTKVSVNKKPKAKSASVKRGRKPPEKFPKETIRIADQLG